MIPLETRMASCASPGKKKPYLVSSISFKVNLKMHTAYRFKKFTAKSKLQQEPLDNIAFYHRRKTALTHTSIILF